MSVSELQSAVDAGIDWDECWIIVEYMSEHPEITKKLTVEQVHDALKDTLLFQGLLLRRKVHNLLRQIPIIWRFV